MRFTSTSSLAFAAALASVASGHSTFTTLFINDVSQGDGTCVRMPMDGATATAPIAGLMSDDMACGRDGTAAVPFICPAPASAKLSFLWRMFPDGSQEGAIDGSHQGPCGVYVKQVADMFNTPATGSGWFKIWEEGYDEAAGLWCTEKLINNKGLMSVQLPSGLPAGYYLIRPELLALQQAQVGDPQYYAGCAQIFIDEGASGTLEIPADNEVSIPGYIDGSEPGNTFNVYQPSFPYPIPGPRPFNPTAGGGVSAAAIQTQSEGVIPDSCLVKNANWCGEEVPSYGDEAGCWAASQDCYNQADGCFNSAPPTGSDNCDVWLTKCEGIQQACGAGNFNGPPNQGQRLQAAPEKVPGAIPAAQNGGQGGSAAVVNGDNQQTTAPAPAVEENEVNPVPNKSSADEEQPALDFGNQEEEDVAPEEEEEIASNVSTDGTCGGVGGKTCRGSVFGSCCSAAGWCGSTKAYCRTGCQSEFGKCRQQQQGQVKSQVDSCVAAKH